MAENDISSGIIWCRAGDGDAAQSGCYAQSVIGPPPGQSQ